jgi:hypothetical protein
MEGATAMVGRPSTSWLTVAMELGNYPTADKPNISHYVLD